MDEMIFHIENPKDSMKYPTKQILETNKRSCQATRYNWIYIL